MKNYHLFYFTVLMTIFACEKSETDPYYDTLSYTAPVNLAGFDDLEVGDEYRYVYFLGENYFVQDNCNYEILSDTLEIEVCGIEDGKYVVSEKINPNSAMLNDDYYFFKDSVFVNYWSIRNDSLIIDQHPSNENFYSHLFLRNPNSLSLIEDMENETEICGWKTTDSGYEWETMQHALNDTIAGEIFPHINITINNVSMALDGPGYSFYYTLEDGILRTSEYSAWTGAGVGWERLLE